MIFCKFFLNIKKGENRNLIYIGTFDGYEGNVASTKCVDQLHLGLLKSLSSYAEHIKFDQTKYTDDEINNLGKFAKTLLDENQAMSQKTSLKDEETQLNQSSFYNLELTSKSHQELTKDLGIPTESLTEEEKRNMKMFKASFKYAYRQMDKLLSRGKDETSKLRWSGSTTCTCVIENRIGETGAKEGWIHIANCGSYFKLSFFLTTYYDIKTYDFSVKQIRRRGSISDS